MNRDSQVQESCCQGCLAARGAIDSILEAIKGDRFTDGLQTAEQYVRHVLGTHGHLLHVEGFMDVVGERDEARSVAEELARALERVGDKVWCGKTQAAEEIATAALSAFRERYPVPEPAREESPG